MPARCGITIGVTDIQLKTSNYVFSLVYAHRARGNGSGFWLNLIVGIIGGVLGGWLFSLFGLIAVGTLGSLITSVAGAIVLLLIASGLTRRKREHY